MSHTNILLAGLLVVLLLVASSNLRGLAAAGLCFWLFLICLIISGIAGFFGGIRLAGILILGQSGYHIPGLFLVIPLSMSLVAVLTCLILYCAGVLSVVRLIEKKQKVELAKPGIRLLCGFLWFHI